MKNIHLINSLTITVFVFSTFYLLGAFILFQVAGEYFTQISKFIISFAGPVLAMVVDLLTYQVCKK